MQHPLDWPGMKKISIVILALAAWSAMPVTAPAATFSDPVVRNLNAAFLGESNAHQRYLAFAVQADKEGYPQVARLFRAAARAEQIHRDNHRTVIVEAGAAVDQKPLDEVKVGTTAENLRAAISGESYERDTMYPGFIATAKAENAREAVRTFQFAIAAEKQHAALYQAALDQLGRNEQVTYFVCPVCGNTVTARPGEKCPVCRRPGEDFVAIN